MYHLPSFSLIRFRPFFLCPSLTIQPAHFGSLVEPLSSLCPVALLLSSSSIFFLSRFPPRKDSVFVSIADTPLTHGCPHLASTRLSLPRALLSQRTLHSLPCEALSLSLYPSSFALPLLVTRHLHPRAHYRCISSHTCNVRVRVHI